MSDSQETFWPLQKNWSKQKSLTYATHVTNMTHAKCYPRKKYFHAGNPSHKGENLTHATKRPM